MCARGPGWSSIALAIALAVASPARAQQGRPAIAWSAPCGDAVSFVAVVEGLGGSFEGVEVEVEAREVEAGSFHGRLAVARGGETIVLRELDDRRCEDVVDALAIAAALALRSLPREPIEPSDAPAEPTTTPDTAAVTTDPATSAAAAGPPAAPIASVPEPAAEPLRLAIGASLRGGLGPTPGAALAPGVVLALQYDRLLAALSISFWPDAAATFDGSARGVSLWAIGSTIEAGYRIGDELAVVPCVVIEPSVAVARGTGVERPREAPTFVLDAGFAVWATLDLDDRVRLFARADLLFGVVRPSYGVESEVAFVGPVLRGTGGAGVLVLF